MAAGEALQVPVKTARFEDAVLVRQVQAGETFAFTELVTKYQDRVYNTCLRICGHTEDARDLTQDAFLQAFESIASFRGKSAFFTWLFRIAVNMSISHRRKRKARNAASLQDEKGTLNGPSSASQLTDERGVDPSTIVEKAEQRALVADCLLQLESDQRAVLVLRDMEGFDYQEIADILEIPVGTVKSRVFRGRLALRKLMIASGNSGH